MNQDSEDMFPEYDFSGQKGVRGKYAKAYRQGHSVRIVDGDSVISEEYYAAIEPDVRKYFPDSRSVNTALRTLISLVRRDQDSAEN
jgi:hypothetical protein